MARSKTSELLTKLNEVRNITHTNSPGYTFFADVTGNGVYNPKVYVVVNCDGGVTLSDLNDTNPRRRCAKIRDAIARAERVKAEEKQAYADFMAASEAVWKRYFARLQQNPD